MKTIAQFANENAEVVSTFQNELQVGDDGWAMIAPFGDFPGVAIFKNDSGQYQKLNAIQRVDQESAQAMVRRFKSPLQKLKRFIRGLPIFHGHPDSPAGLGDKYADKSAKGVMVDLVVREDGLYGLPTFTNEGAELLESRRARAFSARWNSDLVGDENGKKVFRPSELLSVGLTSNPNLPVQWLNEAGDPGNPNQPQPNNGNIMEKSKIIAWLNSLGATLTDDATDEQIQAAMDSIKSKVGETASVENERNTIATERDTLKDQLKNTATELETKKTELANERQARSNMLLDQALADGRITPAQRPEWAGKLAADFANESTNLSKLTPQAQTKSVVDLTGRKAEMANMADRREKVQGLVQDEMNKSNCSYDVAYRRVQSNNPALFEAMKKPATA